MTVLKQWDVATSAWVPIATSAAAGFVPLYSGPRPNTIVLAGDSRVAREMQTAFNQQAELGPFVWANAMLGGRFRVVKNAGVSGDTTTQLLARWAADVTAYTSGWVLINCGVNDATADVTAATLKANFITMFAKAKNEGKRIIILTIQPNDAHTTARKRVVDDVNRWMQDQTDTAVDWANIVVVDAAGPIADPSNGHWLSTMSADGIHGNRRMAARVGKKIYEALVNITPATSPLPIVAGDGNNLMANGLMSGTVGNNTPASWTVSGTAVINTVARTDQQAGQWLEIDKTAASGDVQVNQKQLLTAGGLVIGDVIFGVVEIESDAWTSETACMFYVQCQDTNNAVQLAATTMHHVADTNTILENQPGLGRTWVLRTPDITIPATVTKINLIVQFTGQGKLRFTRAGVFKTALAGA